MPESIIKPLVIGAGAAVCIALGGCDDAGPSAEATAVAGADRHDHDHPHDHAHDHAEADHAHGQAAEAAGVEPPTTTPTTEESAVTQSPSQTAAGTALTSLQSKLDARRAESRASYGDEVAGVIGRGVQDVVEQDIAAGAITVGDTAPAFELANATGETVTLAGLLADGPVVLTWYRGGWCPYCNIQLRAYQERLAEIRSLGATLVALTPETPDHSLNTAEKNGLEFQVLTDADNQTAGAYGLVFAFGDELKDLYSNQFGHNLPAWNGADAWELPLAATYVINTDGVVTYSFLDAEYTRRAEPDEIIAALAALDNAGGAE